MSEEEQRYSHSSRSEIITLLLAVIRTKGVVNIGANNGKSALWGKLDMIEPEGRYMIMSCAATPVEIEQALRSDELQFSTSYDRARIEFVVNRKAVRRARNDTLLLVDLPTLMVRFDRRSAFRIRLPEGRGVRCAIPSGPKSNQLLEHFDVFDLSTGGLALGAIGEAPLLQPGARFRDCSIILPKVGTPNINIELRHVMESVQGDRKVKRIGCRFLDLSSSALASVQRYLTLLELEQNPQAPSLDFVDA